MSNQFALKFTVEEAQEMPMVDLAFAVLKATNTPMYYRDLMQEIAKIKGISDDEVMQVIAQVYTEINIDGRFACVGNNLWGLKRWYPIDRSEDSVGSAERPRIINDDDDDELDDAELFGEEAESYEAEEDFDTVSDEDEDMFDVEAEEEVDEEVEELDEELDEEMESEEDADEELSEDFEDEADDELDDFESDLEDSDDDDDIS